MVKFFLIVIFLSASISFGLFVKNVKSDFDKKIEKIEINDFKENIIGYYYRQKNPDTVSFQIFEEKYSGELKMMGYLYMEYDSDRENLSVPLNIKINSGTNVMVISNLKNQKNEKKNKDILNDKTKIITANIELDEYTAKELKKILRLNAKEVKVTFKRGEVAEFNFYEKNEGEIRPTDLMYIKYRLLRIKKKLKI